MQISFGLNLLSQQDAFKMDGVIVFVIVAVHCVTIDCDEDECLSTRCHGGSRRVKSNGL